MSRAFTVVELLVVVAVVALLAALLTPMFSAVRDRASHADRLERLRQIHVASALYDLDNSSATPVGEPGLLVTSGYLPTSQVDEPRDRSPRGYGNLYRLQNGKPGFAFHLSASGYLDGYEPELAADLPNRPRSFRVVICPQVVDKGRDSWAPTGRYVGLGFDGSARTAVVQDLDGHFRFASLFFP